MAELPGEFGGKGQNGVGHALVIGVGVWQAPAGQKGPVHLFPHAVGVDQGSVQIK